MHFPQSDGPPALPVTPLSPAAPRSPLAPLSPAFLARGVRHSARRGTTRYLFLALLATLALVALSLPLLPGLSIRGSLLVPSLLNWGHVAESGGAMSSLTADDAEQRHPIFELMHIAEKRWSERLDRQSRTLQQAIAEYRRRYNRPPPAGFDDWFRWARANSVVFVDEFDRLERSIEVFGGFAPAALRRMITDFERENAVVDGSTRVFQIRIEGGECVGRGKHDWVQEIGSGRRSGWEFCEALKEVLHLLPDTPDLLYSTHDLGQITMLYNEQEVLRTASRSGQRKSAGLTPKVTLNNTMLEHSRETGYLAAALTCPPDSPARRLHEDLMTGKLVWESSSDGYALPEQLGGFIFNASIAQDACFNTELRQVAGLFLQWSDFSSIIDLKGTPKSRMLPYFSQSKLPTQVDWLIPQLYAYPTLHDRLPDVYTPPPWEQKQARLIWRGKATGVVYPGSHTIGGDWRESQRLRLHKQCNDPNGFERYVYASSPETGSIVVHGSALRKDLLSWYECGLTGPHDCGYDDCAAIKSLFEGPSAPFEWKPNESHYERFKFIADVDGFGWSGRFRELLMTGSVVIKATAFPEFFSDIIEPYYHYVPFNLDASDLPSLMAFFAGSPSTGAGAHDDLAQSIGERGRAFVERHWRKEDIQAWVWRVLLEYRRLFADDAGSMDLAAPL